MNKVVKGSVSSQIPNWVFNIETNYSTYIKTIDNVVIVHIDEVHLGDQSNKARSQSTLNQSIKNQLRDDFDENGWREDQEPAIIFINKDTVKSSLSTPKKYDAHLCIHRLTGVKETTGTGDANFQKTFPAVVVELENGLTSQEVNFILSYIHSFLTVFFLRCEYIIPSMQFETAIKEQNNFSKFILGI